MYSEKIKIRRALLSVSDKTGIKGVAKFLHEQGVEIISTGGTAKAIGNSGIPYTNIESVTGNPEAFGGRMKTISFPVASALLYRRGHTEDESQAKDLGIVAIDLIICNLYHFAEAIAAGADESDLIEKIDIGGPTMVRAAAKNYSGVTVLTNPEQYVEFMELLKTNSGEIDFESRRKFAVAAFQHTAEYETMIAQELTDRFSENSLQWLQLKDGRELRYGENPHQSAKYYRSPKQIKSEVAAIAGANIIQGKPLSYNNIMDADAAHRSASDAWVANSTAGVSCAVIKHMNPCGLAVADTALRALELAWEGDSVSAFGGVLCFSGEVGEEVAEWLRDKFIEVLIVPYLRPEAIKIFAKKKNLRILLCPPRDKIMSEQMLKSVSGGILIQEEDEGLDPELQSVTKVEFPEEKRRLAHFGVMAAKHLRSNAVALVKLRKNGELQLVGAGMGQPNRVDSIRRLAGPRAKEKIEKEKNAMDDLILISDAFFPFADNIEEAFDLGIKFIIQPGGSIRDEEVIRACDELGVAMAFTGRRHFRH